MRVVRLLCDWCGRESGAMDVGDLLPPGWRWAKPTGQRTIARHWCSRKCHRDSDVAEREPVAEEP